MRFILAVAFAGGLAGAAAAQSPPEITAEQHATALAAVEAANLSGDVYKQFWCAGTFAFASAMQTQAADTAGAQKSRAGRDALYGKAAATLLAAGVAEPEFTALAENVYTVAVYQSINSAGKSPDFTLGQCETIAAE